MSILPSSSLSSSSLASSSSSSHTIIVKYFPNDDFKYIRPMGKGSFGSVSLMVHNPSNIKVAVKKSHFSTRNMYFYQAALSEIEILHQLEHPNIVTIFGVIRESPLYISAVLEFMPTDLQKVIAFYGAENLLQKQAIKTYMHQLVLGVQHMHNNNIMHRDLKPSNILINNYCLKIADFGISRRFNKEGFLTDEEQQQPTLPYRAPELLLGAKTYSYAVDIWAIGCIFAEMSNGYILFNCRREYDQLLNIFSILTTPTLNSWPTVNEYPLYNEKLPKFTQYTLHRKLPNIGSRGFNLIYCLLCCDPGLRLNATEILKHPYFTKRPKSPSPPPPPPPPRRRPPPPPEILQLNDLSSNIKIHHSVPILNISS